MALGPDAWSALRLALSRALREGAAAERVLAPLLVAQAKAEYAVPARIGDYTDFYTSVHHATNVGKQFRPDNPLLPNYKWVPIGYHGRVVEHRRLGAGRSPAARADDAARRRAPQLRPSRRLDYELELGIFIGAGNAAGEPIAIADAESHVFGLCLLNDWSARDIQAWEYQPLGPFLAKNFATTISPWIVTLEALAPLPRAVRTRRRATRSRCRTSTPRPTGAQGAFDIQLEVLPATRDACARPGKPRCRSATHQLPPRVLDGRRRWSRTTRSTAATCSPATCSAAARCRGRRSDQAGALIELTVGGKQPITLPNGETRTFLEDGDAVIIRGWCEAPAQPASASAPVSALCYLPSRSAVSTRRISIDRA